MDQIKTGNNGNFCIVAEPLVLSADVNSHTKCWFDLAFSVFIVLAALCLLIPMCMIFSFFSEWHFIFRYYWGVKTAVVSTLYKIRSLKRTTTTLGLGWLMGMAW